MFIRLLASAALVGLIGRRRGADAAAPYALVEPGAEFRGAEKAVDSLPFWTNFEAELREHGFDTEGSPPANILSLAGQAALQDTIEGARVPLQPPPPPQPQPHRLRAMLRGARARQRQQRAMSLRPPPWFPGRAGFAPYPNPSPTPPPGVMRPPTMMMPPPPPPGMAMPGPMPGVPRVPQVPGNMYVPLSPPSVFGGAAVRLPRVPPRPPPSLPHHLRPLAAALVNDNQDDPTNPMAGFKTMLSNWQHATPPPPHEAPPAPLNPIEMLRMMMASRLPTMHRVQPPPMSAPPGPAEEQSSAYAKVRAEDPQAFARREAAKAAKPETSAGGAAAAQKKEMGTEKEARQTKKAAVAAAAAAAAAAAKEATAEAAKKAKAAAAVKAATVEADEAAAAAATAAKKAAAAANSDGSDDGDDDDEVMSASSILKKLEAQRQARIDAIAAQEEAKLSKEEQKTNDRRAKFLQAVKKSHHSQEKDKATAKTRLF